MRRTRVAALAVTLVLVIAAAVALTIGVAPVRSPAGQLTRRPAPTAVDPAVQALAAHEARLGARRQSRDAVAPPRRDPFRFSDRHTGSEPDQPRRGEPALSTRNADATTARPLLSLVGIAEDRAGSAPIRTAIISTAEGLYLLKEGQRLDRRFEILRITAGDVQVRDLTTEAIFTLTLR